MDNKKFFNWLKWLVIIYGIILIISTVLGIVWFFYSSYKMNLVF